MTIKGFIRIFTIKMSDEAIKQRLKRAKKSAIKTLISAGYKVILSDNSNFCIIGTRKKETRIVRVVIDRITDEDFKLTKDFDFPKACTKEIWCKKLNEKTFKITEI